MARRSRGLRGRRKSANVLLREVGPRPTPLDELDGLPSKSCTQTRFLECWSLTSQEWLDNRAYGDAERTAGMQKRSLLYQAVPFPGRSSALTSQQGW